MEYIGYQDLTDSYVRINLQLGGVEVAHGCRNSASGRAELEGLPVIPDADKAEIMAAWGDTPTVPDAPEIPIPEPRGPSIEEQLHALQIILGVDI